MRFFSVRVLMLLCAFSFVQANLKFDVQDPNTLSINSGDLNEVRRSALIKLIKTDSSYVLDVNAGTRDVVAEALIVDNLLADLDIAIKATTKTIDAVNTAGKLELDLVLTAKSNPESLGGYQVVYQGLAPQFNLNYYSADFLKFQTNASSTDQSQLLFFNLLLSDDKTLVHSWFTVQNSTLITDTWSTDRLIVVDDSFGSAKEATKTFKISMTKDFLALLPEGTFVFRLSMGMNPYSKPAFADEIVTYDTIVDEQSSFFNNMITDIDGILKDRNSVLRLSTNEVNQLKTNRTLIFSIYSTFLKDVKTQYQVFAASSSATFAEITSLDVRIAAIDASIEALNVLIAAASS